jgi:hypothetical protein
MGAHERARLLDEARTLSHIPGRPDPAAFADWQHIVEEWMTDIDTALSDLSTAIGAVGDRLTASLGTLQGEITTLTQSGTADTAALQAAADAIEQDVTALNAIDVPTPTAPSDPAPTDPTDPAAPAAPSDPTDPAAPSDPGTAPGPGTGSDSPIVVPPVDSVPTDPSDPTAPTDPAAVSYYTYAADVNPGDQNGATIPNWVLAPVTASDGMSLYTFSGDATTVDATAWVLYTGTTSADAPAS